MPSNRDFDEILKNKFQNFEAPLPNGGWNSIKDKIPKERKKGVFWMPLMMAASVLMTILSGYFFIKNSDSVVKKELLETNENSSISKKRKAIVFNGSDNQIVDNLESNGDKKNSNKEEELEKLDDLTFPLIKDKTLIVKGDNSSLHTSKNTIIPIIAGNSLISRNVLEEENGDFVNNVGNTEVNHDVLSLNENNYQSMNIELMPLTKTKLTVPNGRKNKLNEAILIAELQDDDIEIKDKIKKFHFGISIAPIYTSKRLKGNTEDNITVSQYQGLNKFNKKRTGYSMGLINEYDFSPKISLIVGLNFTNISDENTYLIVDEVGTTSINRTSNNSISFSTVKEIEKTTTSVIHYLEFETGLKYLVSSEKGIYLKAKGGVSKLLYSEGVNKFTKYNHNTSLSIGKEYKIGKHIINIEPEITYYIKSYQSEGDIMAKPTTFGINLIAIH